jgi:DDE superfamily endonuclease
VISLEEMGPESAKSTLGPRLVRAQAQDQAGGAGRPAERAPQEADDGRRGKGDRFGALRPATGEVFTTPYERRTAANRADFLAHVEAWLPTSGDPVDAIVDHVRAHRATDVLLFSLTHPRWEFVSQPKYAAYLNLIAPWWKVLRSLARKGRRFETWAEVCQAVEAATASWNQHRHPFVWGRRRRHRPRRKPGIAALPTVA